MVRHVFFSFHYERDHWRANQVRNCWVTQKRDVAGFIDSAEWEELKKQSDSEIESWIDDQLNGTSVTVVLIGSETFDRKWINYEIEQSTNRGNGLLGVRVHNLKNEGGFTDYWGKNPLSIWRYTNTGEEFTDVWPTYDWKNDYGYDNFGEWVEEAKTIAERR